MATRDGLVLVLWAPRFDELAATVFVTTLRSAGLCVKLVSLSSSLLGGSHGLGLVPDLSLEAALAVASTVSCLIVPCDSPEVRRLAAEPRVRELFYRLPAWQTPLVVGLRASPLLAELDLLPPGAAPLVPFSSGPALLAFAARLAAALAAGAAPHSGPRCTPVEPLDPFEAINQQENVP